MGMIKPVHPVIHFRLKQEIIGQIDEWRSNVAVFLFIINCWEIPLYLLVVLLSIKRLRINACGRVFPDETLALKTGYSQFPFLFSPFPSIFPSKISMCGYPIFVELLWAA